MSPRRLPDSHRTTKPPHAEIWKSQDKVRHKEEEKHHPFAKPHPHPPHKPQKKPKLAPKHHPHPEPLGKNVDVGPLADRPRPGKLTKKATKPRSSQQQKKSR
jgi:hypothetical protein